MLFYRFQGSLQQRERDELHGKLTDDQFKYSHLTSALIFATEQFFLF